MGGIPAGFSLLPQEQRPTQIGPNGNPIDTVQETTDLKRLRIEAEEAEKAYRALAETAQETVVQATTPLEYTDKDAGKNAKAAEQRRRLLEDLKSQTALEVAQLDEQVAKVRELERQAEITARIRQLEDAGFKAAQARAISGEVQTKLDEARARAMEREEGLLKRGWDLDIARLDENWATVRAIEEEVEKRELVAALAKVTGDETSAIAKAESMLIELPSCPPIKEAVPRYVSFGVDQDPILGGPQSKVLRMGDRWAIDVETYPAEYAEHGMKYLSRLVRGLKETVRLAFPEPGVKPRPYGSPVVASPGSAGTSLPVSGLIPGDVIRERAAAP